MALPDVHPSNTSPVTVAITEYARLYYEDHAKALGISADEYIRQLLEDVPYRAMLRVSS